ncbi:MAG: T9SS type A sorting domain-containing protein [bacterium]|nr:T9SS type A sorting domain-containing protein [bacterium]
MCSARIAPNPFNPITTVTFDLPQPGRVRLAVFDPSGRLVRSLVDEERVAGSHEVIWNGLSDHGQQVASGVYVCRMEAGPFRETRRMTLLK